jgi:hypothetical protein
MNNPKGEFEGTKIESWGAAQPKVFHSTILKETRSWAISLLILGVISLLATGFLSAPWGILLIVVGLASFYFRSSAMMVVYAVTLVWAGISNLTSGQAFWIGFAIIQAIMAFLVFRKFISFRKAEESPADGEFNPSELTPERSATIFPWAAGALGVFSLLGLIGIFAGIIIQVYILQNRATPDLWGFIEGLVVNLGVLGFALGLASILCKYKKKAFAIVGMVTGILTLIIETVFKIIG